MNIFIPQVQLRTPFSPADDLFYLFAIDNSFNAGKKGAIVAIKVKVKVKVFGATKGFKPTVVNN